MAHQKSRDSLPSGGTGDEQFRDVSAVRLIGRGVKQDLDGADEMEIQKGGEQQPLSAIRALENRFEECNGGGAGKWGQETDGSASVNAVDEYAGQIVQIAASRGGTENSDGDHALSGT